MKKILVSSVLAVFAVIAIRVPGAESFPAVEVYKQTSPAVVLIVASSGDGRNQIGAGSVITRDGLIITNAHVILDGSGRPFRTLSLYTRPDEITGDFQKDLTHRHKVEVKGYDRALDLALLQVNGLGTATGVISLADPRDIMVGAEVVAIGHPEQGGLWSLTYGRISGQLSNQGKVKGKDVYQTDTSVNKGNSGGPLLDGRGYLVGVNTNIARRGAGNLAITGVNFALKSSVVSKWVRDKQGVSLAYGTAAAGSDMVASAGHSSASASKSVTVSDERMEEPDEPSMGSVEESHGLPVSGTKDEKAGEPAEAPEKDILEETPKSDTILTPKKPYKEEDLYKAVEREMEDMMMDMKDKFRRKRR